LSTLLIYHECYSDGQFLKTLCNKIGIRYQLNHKQGRSKLIQDKNREDAHFIAIVDKDVNNIEDFYNKISRFEEINNFPSLNIKIYGDAIKKQEYMELLNNKLKNK